MIQGKKFDEYLVNLEKFQWWLRGGFLLVFTSEFRNGYDERVSLGFWIDCKLGIYDSMVMVAIFSAVKLANCEQAWTASVPTRVVMRFLQKRLSQCHRIVDDDRESLAILGHFRSVRSMTWL